MRLSTLWANPKQVKRAAQRDLTTRREHSCHKRRVGGKGESRCDLRAGGGFEGGAESKGHSVLRKPGRRRARSHRGEGERRGVGARTPPRKTGSTLAS